MNTALKELSVEIFIKSQIRPTLRWNYRSTLEVKVCTDGTQQVVRCYAQFVVIATNIEHANVKQCGNNV